MRASSLLLAIVALAISPAGRESPRPARPALAGVPGSSARVLAGQRVIYSYRGPRPPGRLMEAIRAGEAAGVIFFGDNITSRAQIRRVVARLQSAAADGPVGAPLLMLVDQEGGAVRRLGGAPVRSHREIGAASHAKAAAREAGRRAGHNLRAAGMNVNVAPVLDVYRSAGNFIDRFGRSYGRSPRKVGRLGGAFIRAQQATGIAATAKHFPGLGAATRSQDTDRGPVRLAVPLPVLRERDERPYPQALAAGVALIMVSWATYPALDSRLPAGFSPRVVQHELRGRLGFTGVTVTDALGAGAIRELGGTSARARLAAAAGMDLLVCASQDAGEGRRAVDGLEDALRRGHLDPLAFVAAVERITALRTRMPAPPGG